MFKLKNLLFMCHVTQLLEQKKVLEFLHCDYQRGFTEPIQK